MGALPRRPIPRAGPQAYVLTDNGRLRLRLRIPTPRARRGKAVLPRLSTRNQARRRNPGHFALGRLSDREWMVRSRGQSKRRREGVSKYGAKKTEYKGHLFDSKAEAKRAQELELMAMAHEISDISFQPVFVLIYPFTYHGKKYRGVKYIADFKYRMKGTLEWIVEDVKGKRTAAYIIKKQLLLTRYPE